MLKKPDPHPLCPPLSGKGELDIHVRQEYFINYTSSGRSHSSTSPQEGFPLLPLNQKPDQVHWLVGSLVGSFNTGSRIEEHKRSYAEHYRHGLLGFPQVPTASWGCTCSSWAPLTSSTEGSIRSTRCCGWRVYPAASWVSWPRCPRRCRCCC